ncbi:MAG: glyoxalase/bleomycin resistance/dioxygenase family protein [Acidobacteria bacterium]|nr:glyoxalase/bleomycin resistance/dioxygenase family protein [Acidobacteriota bacterium]
MQSAVEFAANTRVHIALDSKDVERSIAFYRILFAQEPTKVRPGYAKFEVADPALNLSLNASATARPAASHFGVQVKSSEAVAEATERFRAAGLATEIEENVTCCYAVQDKVWVKDPDGNAWEIFVVLEADTAEHGKAQEGQCCAPEPALVTLG